MRWRRILRSALLLVLIGTVSLEGIAWLRIPLTYLLHWAYPRVGLGRDGNVVYYDHERVRAEERMIDVFLLLDDQRRVFDTRRDTALDNVVLPGERWRSHAALKPGMFEHPHFLLGALSRRLASLAPESSRTDATLEAFARSMNLQEEARRDLSPQRRTFQVLESPLGPGWSVEFPRRSPLDWTAEAGRLVCREVSSGRVLAGLGPDGVVPGEGGADGTRFGTLLGFNSYPGSWFMIERESRHLIVVPVPADAKVPADSIEPLQAHVEIRPLRPWDAADDTTRKVTASIARLDQEHLLLFDDGNVFERFTLAPGERITAASGVRPLTEVTGSCVWHIRPDCPIADVDVAIETMLMPTPPGLERRRFRLFRPGQAPVERDVTLEPARASEVLPANLSASLALLRPFPLNAASAASGLTERWVTWWWCDPWLADGRYPGWLVASLALAAFLAWRAQRSARERCATIREVRFWTAAVFLLGPVGLLWMRLVLPRVPVESVGGARRAVNLDASPGTSAPWPEPKPLGIEVFS